MEEVREQRGSWFSIYDDGALLGPPKPQINMPAWVFCTSLHVDSDVLGDAEGFLSSDVDRVMLSALNPMEKEIALRYHI